MKSPGGKPGVVPGLVQGPVPGRPRCPALGALLGVLALAASSPLAAQPAVTDARAVAIAGVSLTRVLESSPGALRPEGWEVRLDLVDLYLGTGLVAGCASVEKVGERVGLAVALVGLWSPVGESHALRCGTQVRIGGLRAGAGLDVRAVSLDRYARAWEIVPRLGCGWDGGRVAIAAVAERVPGPESRPRGALAFALRVARGIDIGIQSDREPGVPATLRFGLGYRPGPLVFFAGLESSAQVCSLGFSWIWGRQEIAWAGSTHPALGWSHAWTYAVSHGS